MGKRATILGEDGKTRASMTDTRVCRYSDWRTEAFVPGWDQQNGGSAVSRMARLKKRVAMGQKLTPIGRGTTIKR